MIIDIKQIEELLKSEITSYQIMKNTGIHTQMIDRYRANADKLENMRLKTAIKLMEFIDEKNKKRE